MTAAPGSFFDPATLDDPHAFYAWLRREAPVWQVPETGHWVVSRHADALRVCLDPETFSARLAAIVTRDESGAVRLLDLGIANTPKGAVLGVADGELHARHRASVVRAFAPRRLRQLEDVVRGIARECVQACVRARRVDLVRDLARPVPARLMAALLGLPREDDARLQEWSDAALSIMGGLPPRAEIERHHALVAELEAYLAQRFEAARRAPGEDVMGDLAHLAASGGLSGDEARGILYQLVVGGTETTVGLVAAAVRFAAELPGMWERLGMARDDVAAFVEEAVRLETPAKGNYRRTTRAARLGGAELPEGATLALLWGSANRDEAEFPDPHRFEPARPNAKAQLGFGHGPHFCLGAAVARMETRIVLEELFASGARVRVAPGPHRYVPSVFLRRLASLEAELA